MANVEKRDLYDAAKRPTGETIENGQTVPEGKRILCVGCWILSTKGEIFLTQRAFTKSFMPGKWENTGGHAVAGEDGKAAALREIFEETGIRAEREALFPLHEHTEAEYFAEEFVLVKDFSLSEVSLQEGETISAQWVTLPRWEEMLENGEIAPSIREKLQPCIERLRTIVRDLQRR